MEGVNMTIQVSENTIGIWWSNILQGAGDILVHLEKESDKISMTMRIRYYDPDDPSNDPFSGKDEKKWVSSICKSMNVEKEKETIRYMLKNLDILSNSQGELFEILMNEKGMGDFIERFSKLPFVHLKVEDIGTIH